MTSEKLLMSILDYYNNLIKSANAVSGTGMEVTEIQNIRCIEGLLKKITKDCKNDQNALCMMKKAKVFYKLNGRKDYYRPRDGESEYQEG